ncbi:MULTISPECIES: ribosome maturation factor RimM [Pontibacillus]|uniref:Ribosome maturation factor RimM n=1 Tax=Pontibacillus chungwhensis TaxID=265426 RepID=A0ABY8V5S6_9BACI|nr:MULTISPECIES: ribosome maturation factor RimM [Pontibacillus]MCD5322661.1 ribosome maturation factor RimM [Pontibacillus sp. HN14]WIF99939.1 ribosome maturation factor RimM [Pontibacillus chungwhensis]
MDKELYTIGKVVNTHGVRGEIRVIQVTDFEERFEPGNQVYWVPQSKQDTPLLLTIKGHRMHKSFHLLHFEEYSSLNEVESLKGGTLAITKEQQTPLDEGEFYYHEVIGCTVKTADGNVVGTVKEILSPGGNDVWVVGRPQQKDALIPYIEQVVTEVDITHKTITIEPMEGLLD